MTAAAERLGYTTGAVSQQIAALQANLQETLFIRDGRTLVLTDAGVSLLTHARSVLEAETRAADSVRKHNNDQSLTVRLGVFGSAALFALPPTLALVRKSPDTINIQAFEVKLDDMPRAIMEDRLDIALSVNYPDAPNPPHRGLLSTELHTEVFRMVMPADAEHSTVSRRKLLRYCNEADWILPPADQAFGKAALFACARAGIHPKVRHAVEDTALSLALAESGVGITVATPLMLALRPTEAVLADLPAQATRTIVALTRSSSSHRESIQLVLQALRESFRMASRSGDTAPATP